MCFSNCFCQRTHIVLYLVRKPNDHENENENENRYNPPNLMTNIPTAVNLNHVKQINEFEMNNYELFMHSLASKYQLIIDKKQENMDQLKSDIIQFMQSQRILFIEFFENLQDWIYQLLLQTDKNENKLFVENLFNLMVMAMLYNDQLRIRPQLRGLLRFGSYYQLNFNSVLFNDDQIMGYLNKGIMDKHHPLNPFQFYISQIVQHNQQKQKKKHRKLLQENKKKQKLLMDIDNESKQQQNEQRNNSDKLPKYSIKVGGEIRSFDIYALSTNDLQRDWF